MTYLRNAEYAEERKRPNLLTHYVSQMTSFLKLKHPEKPQEDIVAFVKKVIKERYKSPQVEAVYHKAEGYSEDITMSLDKYIVTVVADNNLAPSGTSYLPVSKKESFLRVSIESKIKERGAFKKIYLDFEAQGKKRESQYYYQNQANAKIFNNAIAGGMNIKQFILGCKAGFNSITSVGRLSVKQAYSFIERAVNGNLYLPNTRAAITYILNHTRHMHTDFHDLLVHKGLYTPTTQEVLKYIVDSVRNYEQNPDVETLTSILDGLTATQKAYVFYAGCFNNLCRFNEDMMRSWINSCFLPENIDPSLYSDIEISEVKTFSGDVIACILSASYKRLGRKPGTTDKWNSLKDAAINHPEGLKEFIYCCRHFVKTFETFIPVIKPIMQIQTTFSKMVFQQRMARYTVPLSDTDSNIFSTQELIRWKRGKIDFSQEAYEMNALTTFILSQSLEHVFAKLSAGFGVEGKDVFKISMKNEFLYPILIATSSAKHYLAIASMQEGSLLPNPRKDIKGVGFRSSTYPKVIREGFEKFTVDLFAEISKGDPIRGTSILEHVSNLEREVHRSLRNRESTYLQTVTVKRKEEYADPNTSQYFYHDLWKEVFSEDYGEMVIPNKCFKIPLKGGKRMFKDQVFMDKFQESHPRIHERLVAFMEKNPKRDITTILVPPSKGKINDFFMKIADVRSQVSQIMTPYYLMLNALGIGSVDTRADGLVSDFFDVGSEMLQ